MTSNQIAYWKHLEDKRHNLATEAIDTGKLNVSYQQMLIEGAKAGETARHNLVGEQLSMRQLSESERANLVREAETQRTNMAHESIAAWQVSENQRHNIANEGEQKRTNYAKEFEQRRSNMANEEIAAGNLAQRDIENQIKQQEEDRKQAELKLNAWYKADQNEREWTSLIMNNLNPLTIFKDNVTKLIQ